MRQESDSRQETWAAAQGFQGHFAAGYFVGLADSWQGSGIGHWQKQQGCQVGKGFRVEAGKEAEA